MKEIAEGDGPVNALDAALRKALVRFYPQLARMNLVDYKVRHHRQRPRHRRQNPRLHRIQRRRKHLGHRRRQLRHHRSQLARPPRQHRLSPRTFLAMNKRASSSGSLVPKLCLGTQLSPQLRCSVLTMRSRYRINETHAAHFVTSTVIEWLPTFTSAACCDILVRSFQHCREHKGLKVYAWVILDNHFHAILSAPDLVSTLRDLRKYTARSVLDHLKRSGCDWLLNQLAYHCAANKIDSHHQVWQEGHPSAGNHQ